eukprot:scaffold115773_cov18-Tisochrysis_lutea.AAC.1
MRGSSSRPGACPWGRVYVRFEGHLGEGAALAALAASRQTIQGLLIQMHSRQEWLSTQLCLQQKSAACCRGHAARAYKAAWGKKGK